jgi:HK97 family phage major capsid protein
LRSIAAQGEGTDSLGGYTVPVEQARTIVHRLRAGSVFLKARPRIFTMTSNQLRIPRVSDSSTVAMVSENGLIPESNLTFAATTLTAHKAAGIVRCSDVWLNDLVPDAREIIEGDLLGELGQKLDEQFFGGNGTPPNILGLLNDPNVTDTALAGAITFDAIAAAIERLETDGATA